MNDRDALLSAILAHPDEDTPRLVFADWLDENDSPHWAALIRAECARERLRADGPAPEALLRFLANIEAQGGCGKLVQRVRWGRADPEVGARVDCAKPVPRLRRASAKVRRAGRPTRCGLAWGAETHRGFPAAATVVDGTRLAKRLGDVTRWCPPVELTINTSPNRPVNLVGSGLLAWTRGLNLHDSHPGLFEAMSADPNAAGVRALTWRADGDDPTAVAAFTAALAGSPHWAGLRALDVTEDDIEGEGAEAIFGAEHLSGLTRLHLLSRRWTRETVDAFLRGPFHNLEELALDWGTLDDDAAERLAAAPVLGNVRYLDLSHNDITARGAAALFTSKHLKNLTILELEGNRIGNLDRAALAAAPAGGLRALSLHNCGLGTDDVTALAGCPRLSELVYLDLDFNNLDHTAVSGLVATLPRAPAIVYLMGNRISTKGAEALARWAGTPGLDQLHVCRNPLPRAGVAALAASPHLAGLRHLCVSGLNDADRGVLTTRFKTRVEFPS